MSRSSIALAGAIGLLAACSSSTAPADPFLGQWKVSVASSVAGDSLVPDTFVVSVTKTGGVYHVAFPPLEAIHDPYHLAIADTAASSGFAGRGDSLFIGLGVAGAPCYVSLSGAVNGGSAAGSVILQAASCSLGTPTVGTWTGVKQ